MLKVFFLKHGSAYESLPILCQLFQIIRRCRRRRSETVWPGSWLNQLISCLHLPLQVLLNRVEFVEVHLFESSCWLSTIQMASAERSSTNHNLCQSIGFLFKASLALNMSVWGHSHTLSEICEARKALGQACYLSLQVLDLLHSIDAFPIIFLWRRLLVWVAVVHSETLALHFGCLSWAQ